MHKTASDSYVTKKCCVQENRINKPIQRTISSLLRVSLIELLFL